MLKTTQSCAVLLAALFAAAPAMAQTGSPATTTPAAPVAPMARPGAVAPMPSTRAATTTNPVTPLPSAMLATPSSGDMLVSNMTGSDVYGSDGKKAATVKDISLSSTGQADAIILGVGGVVGVGARDVAVSPSAVHSSMDNGKLKLTIDSTYDQLKTAPEFDTSKMSTR